MLENKKIDPWDDGFQKFNLMDKVLKLGMEQDFVKLSSAYANFDPDPYDHLNSRFRAYGRGAYYPWKQTFEWFPDQIDHNGCKISSYYQGGHNPEHISTWRQFSAMSPELKDNPVIIEIIKDATTRAVFYDENLVRPIGVGIHLIRQKVDLKNPIATVSPNVLHQDGEMYDYVYLVSRESVVGGGSVVAHTRASGTKPALVDHQDVISKFMMTDSLDGFGVKDDAVCHGAEEVTLKKGDSKGYRDTILVDLTPMYDKLR